jgi:hypothetical protein
MAFPRLISALLLTAATALAGSRPVEFEFVAPENPATLSPYSRELWVDVVTPSGAHLTLPAYYADGGLFAVHVRPEEVGFYHFGSVSETTLGIKKTDLVVSVVSAPDVDVTQRTRLPSVGIDPANARRFRRSDGVPFLPVGANLAWSPQEHADTADYYRRALPEFARADLNWMRVWMAHWDGLNLDWLPPQLGPSPRPGAFDEGVAETWDKVVNAAEDSGVYLQIVLQHHGQYNTKNDSNWSENPWNAANPGGFLKTPEDFFTNANARVITLLKYRYIVARWGWSTAVFSWELFNEVHWTDSMRNGREADVARWHADVAAYLRQVDVYGHLITTSTENLRSAVYDKMDYLQPHLYAMNQVAAARSFRPAYAELAKPAFYGEEGDDHQALSAAEKDAGTGTVPPVWASVMGEGSFAAAPWDGRKLLDQGRLGELGAVHRFMVRSRLAEQKGLSAFSAPVACTTQVPLRIPACQYWQRRPGPDISFPSDGTDPIEESAVTYALVGDAAGKSDGFPDRATYHLDLPDPGAVTIHVGAVGRAGGALDVLVDGASVGRHAWAGGTPAPVPPEFAVNVPEGTHALSLVSTGPEWVGVTDIDLGRRTPVLAAIGRRNDHFIAAWVYHRSNLYSVSPGAPESGTLDLGETPKGTWKVTWWDTQKGLAGATRDVAHPGGSLRIPTPSVLRHAAVVLVRVP